MGTWRRIGLVLAISALGLLIGDWLYPLDLPTQSASFARVVVDRSGRPLRAFADDQGIWRYQISRDQVAPHYLTALLNYEDRWFYYHPGVNPFSMLRAAWQNLSAGHIVSGGSTLTMQVARLLHPHSRTLGGKAQQILRALQLEWHLSKNDILELYLNHAPFGGAREGVQAASYQYLGKPAANLTRAESALLAVLPQSPTRFRPDRHPQRAQQARDKLLKRMLTLGVWTRQQVDEARRERVSAYTPTRPMLAPLLARRLIREYPQARVIQSSVNADLQQSLQDLAANYNQPLPDGSSTAILVVDDTNQQVIAYVGTARFGERASHGHVDMVQAVRSPGSTLKPFVYGLAMDDGLIHSESLLADTPRANASYRPANFSGFFQGPVSVSQALQLSLNVPAVQVMEQLGPARFSDKLANVGLDLHLPGSARPSAAVILGGVGITLEDLVRGYGAISQDGLVRPLQFTLEDKVRDERYLMSPGAAWIVADILRGIARPGRIRSQATQTARDAIGWKSGTSYGFRDTWAIGFDGRYRVGVWVGRPDGTPMPGHYGALTAAPLMFSVFDILGQQPAPARAAPPSVSQTTICWPLGLTEAAQDPDLCQRRRTAWILDHSAARTLPARSQADAWHANPLRFWINPDSGLLVDASCQTPHREARQVALWPSELEPWIEPRHQRRQLIPPSDPSCPYPLNSLDAPFTILGIRDGAVYRRADRGQTLQLGVSASGGRGDSLWYLNGVRIQRARIGASIQLQLNEIGHYQLITADGLGNIARVEFSIAP